MGKGRRCCFLLAWLSSEDGVCCLEVSFFFSKLGLLPHSCIYILHVGRVLFSCIGRTAWSCSEPDVVDASKLLDLCRSALVIASLLAGSWMELERCVHFDGHECAHLSATSLLILCALDGKEYVHRTPRRKKIWIMIIFFCEAFLVHPAVYAPKDELIIQHSSQLQPQSWDA